MIAIAEKLVNPKDLLDKGIKLHIGDFVTIDDNGDVQVSVVREIDDDEVTLCSIEITESKDDIYIKQSVAQIKDVIYVGESFVNVGGLLWRVRDAILGNQNVLVDTRALRI